MASESAGAYVQGNRLKKAKICPEPRLKSEPRRVTDEDHTGLGRNDLGISLFVRVDSSAVVKLGMAHRTDVVTKNDVGGLQPRTTDIKWIQKEPLELQC